MRVRNNNIFIERKGKQGDAVGDLEKHGDYDGKWEEGRWDKYYFKN